jgi:beta-lactamase superfamily II metal-dependent hydrolase
LTALIASHSDADHIGGLVNLMSSRQVSIETVYVNPDPDQTSASWRDFKLALGDARRRQGTRHSAITTDIANFEFGPLRVDVVAPTPELFLSSPGGNDLRGRRIRSNTMSVVLRVWDGNAGLVLLPGDLDATGLANLLDEGRDLTAKVLVFPHHGGKTASGSTDAFTKTLCRAVQPEVIYFSIGRGRYSNPRPETVAAALEALPNVHIACSQLSGWCSASNPPVIRHHLDSLPANGKYLNVCCAGSMRILRADDLSIFISGHAAFVDGNAPTALCRLRSN